MSNSWSHGYYADEGYEYGYHTETSPSYLQWMCTLQGIDAPKDNFTYLDLGCGQGLSLIFHAALHPDSQFIGVDFMPRHIAHARSLAKRLALRNITFIEADFLDLAKWPDKIGEVDYAVAHGISTWVSKEVRKGMWSLVSKVLKPGGIVYNSYNTYPGWHSASPFQHLVIQLNNHMRGKAAIDLAIRKMSALKDANAVLFEMLPSLDMRIDGMSRSDPAYLVQEYNNTAWQPLYVAEILQEISEYKLDYFGTANVVQLFDASYPPSLLEVINQESSLHMRETIRDFAIGQSFRRDLYAKGSLELGKALQINRLGEQALISTQTELIDNENVVEMVYENLTVTFDKATLQGVIDAFGEKGATVNDVQKVLPQFSVREVAEIATYLIHNGKLGIRTGYCVDKLKKINHELANAHLDGAPYNYLAFGKTNRVIRLRNADMMLLSHHLQGVQNQDLDKKLQETMTILNKRFCIEGREITNPQESLEQAKLHANHFLDVVLPALVSQEVI